MITSLLAWGFESGRTMQMTSAVRPSFCNWAIAAGSTPCTHWRRQPSLAFGSRAGHVGACRDGHRHRHDRIGSGRRGRLRTIHVNRGQPDFVEFLMDDSQRGVQTFIVGRIGRIADADHLPIGREQSAATASLHRQAGHL